MSNALALVPTGGVSVSAPVDVMELGAVLAKSGYFKDARDASQAVVKVLYGQEIGIGPVSAMMGVHIIEGKPAPSANLIAARIKASGRYDYRVREHSGEACSIEFFEQARSGQRESLGTVTWTIAEARNAGLAGKDVWKKYPRAMLFARAISEGARVHCPELFGGAPVYTPEELGAEVDAEGNAVVREAAVVEPATDEQVRDIEYLAADATITPEECVKLSRRVERGMSRVEAEAAIAWLSSEIEARTLAAVEQAADAETFPADIHEEP